MATVINMRVPAEFMRHARDVDARMRGAVKEAFAEGAQMAKDRARSYAPISPMQSQIDRAMTTWKPLPGNANFLIKRSVRNKDGTYRRAKSGEVTIRRRGRKADAHSRPQPGGLMRSIESGNTATEAHVYVAANSAARDYAAIIHDYRGTVWHNLGLGSRAKKAMSPGHVGEKFIERAIKDKKPNFTKTLDKKIKGAFR
ncbi:MAG: hypothetical protein FWF84_05500 [Kiritimatiellaeota bacterium]|nr:hypothetical protein [Kiritimatiellota bacterium]